MSQRWKPEVLDAFRVLGLDIDTSTQSEAAKAYKTQAIRHHPDKNPGDPASTQRFQKVGSAWDICQRHYEDPTRSVVQEWGSRNFDGDEDDFIDPEDLAFFRFMFEEMLFGTYTRASRRNYRSRRGGPQGGTGFYFGPFSYFPGGGYSPGGNSSGGYSGNAQIRQDDNGANERNQARKKTEYEQRLREFEQEIDAEKRELRQRAMEKSKDETRRATAYQQAFLAARTGKTSTVTKLVEEYDLDVNSPEKMTKAAPKKADKPTNHQTLLHAACRSSDEGLVVFLLDRGAVTDALNDAKLHPFHVAIACGNVAVVKYFLLRRVKGGVTPGCHPSKAAPDGRTPLQIAIASGKADMIALMTKEATVHDVERCWQQTEDLEVKEILSAKKGFVDPETKELLRQEADRKRADELAREEQRVADERARLTEKNRLKEERIQKRAAEQLAREEEKRALETERRREAELAKQQREVEEAARKAELEARQKMAADARHRAESEARVQSEAEAARQVADARARAEVQARQNAADQEGARRRAEEEACLRKAAAVQAKRIQRDGDTAKAQAEEERRTDETKREEHRAEEVARRQADALRIFTAERERLRNVAAQEAEHNRRVALEQKKLEAKRAETLRRLEGQAEEHRRQALISVGSTERRIGLETFQQAEARTRPEEPEPSPQFQSESALPPVYASSTSQRRKLSKKHPPRDLGELSAEELQKRAAQSARDKARIAEEKKRKMEAASALQRVESPESTLSNGRQTEDYVPPTPVSMPSPSQRRLPLNPPLVPRHTRPNLEATIIGIPADAMLGPEDIQTTAIPDDLFAVERPVAVEQRERGPAPFRGYARGRGYRGRGRGGVEGRGRGRGRGHEQLVNGC
ncbi:hypothetical protein B0H15DRAFT_1027963 [Mycena belliarum]|uniref:J domain-containing protein n=1 Tax=Mycena belliarum TaxID=1033014 RepID=A0AAD6TL10_9AGAR|nr:hypothetical protein B0H15DRAFT_1027963 [Mycena belliae]